MTKPRTVKKRKALMFIDSTF